MMCDVLDEPTVADLIAGSIKVRATCANEECNHARTIDPARVCFHPSGVLSRLGLVLRCRECGSTGMATRVARPDEM